ncbi:MAG: phytanoyl-CoA dioxygenase family protein [Armatimonadetes bacterium]|nr:phytanoyl-CoA dioxygenase family protein [Armatimonadota bacterium]
MVISAAELKRSFERDGFVIFPDLFGLEEVQALKAEILRLLENLRQEAISAGKEPETILRSGVFVGLAARSPVFQQAVRDERLLNILEILIGSDIAFLSDKVVFKSDETDFGSPWHQDWLYWQGSHKISIWVALDDATPENGCLKLLPGSHKSVVLHNGDASDGYGFVHRLRPDSVDERQAVTAALKAGGAVFFHDLVLHASHPNISKRDRYAWIPTYKNAKDDDPHFSWAVAAAVVRGEGKFCSRCGKLVGAASPYCSSS